MYVYVFVLGAISLSLLIIALFEVAVSPLVVSTLGLEPTPIEDLYSPTTPYGLVRTLFFAPFFLVYCWGWLRWNPGIGQESERSST